MITQDDREDGILVAFGSFAKMEAEGETLPSLWCALADRIADRAGVCSSFAKSVLIAMQIDPCSPIMADEELRDPVLDGAMLLLQDLRIAPAAVDLDHCANAVVIMTVPEWPYFEQIVQALSILHGISDAAAISALWHVCDRDDENLARASYREAMLRSASIFIQHSETLQ